MTYEEIKNDILIADTALTNSKLDIVVKELNLLCEVYCLTPFHWQSFYLRIFDGEQFTLQYVKPYIKDFRGLESISLSFNDVLQAESHVACEGKIVCGIKKVEKTNSTINRLLECLPFKEEIHSDRGIMIDGITTLIINRKNSQEIPLFYRTNEKILNNSYSEATAGFLYNLHEHLEKIIGNIIVRDKQYLTFREMYID